MSLAFLLEPFRHDFVLTAMLVGAFVSAVCAVLSCFVVLKGWALVGDAVSHGVLPGLVLAYLAGLPMALGAIVSGVACVGLAGLVRTTSRVKPDAVLGIAFTGFLAVGLILVAATPSDIHFIHVLFGNLLGIERDDMLQAFGFGGAALLAVAVLRKDLILFCFDPGQARALGLSPARLEFILLLIVAATVVAALKAVGLVLVLAMLTTPGCIGLLLADRFDRVMAIAVASAVAATLLGTLASFYADVATGPAIVCTLAAGFGIAFLASPRTTLRVGQVREPA